MFSLDHTNHARYLPVFIRDLRELETQHPELHQMFDKGHFTVKKSERKFSAIALNQCHEQNNKCIKEDGGVIGLTENPEALLRWMVGGPEVSRVKGTLNCIWNRKKVLVYTYSSNYRKTRT